ncbi:MAG: hypothetical protein D3916_02055 [Candidatus Electrothrix sp. MAN1_4]|nr:hypothetical protein [Candidatus Electrothrix sp. MAN1_4]
MIKKRHASKQWAALLFGIFIIWIVASVIAPIANTHIPGIDRLIFVTEINTIDSGAFWYTDVGVTDEAMIFISGSATSSCFGHEQ